MSQQQKLDPALASLDLTGMLEKLGYLKRTKRAPQPGDLKFNRLDGRTTSALEAESFSGIRANDLWNRFEIWIFGRIEETVSYQQFFLRPESLNDAYCKTFGIDKINLDAAAQRDIQKLQERKAMLSIPEVHKALDALASPSAPVSNIASKKDNFDKQS